MPKQIVGREPCSDFHPQLSTATGMQAAGAEPGPEVGFMFCFFCTLSLEASDYLQEFSLQLSKARACNAEMRGSLNYVSK